MYLNRVIFTLLLGSLFTINIFANELFILPKQNKEVLKHLEELILDSKKEIKVAVYNFSYNKLAKPLMKSAKKGVKVIVYFDKTKVENDDELYKLFKKNNINTIIVKDKLHTKLAIFDNKTAYFGSANWTKKSFKENYEILYFTKDKETISTLNNFLLTLN